MCNDQHVATVRAAAVKFVLMPSCPCARPSSANRILTAILATIQHVRKPDPALLVLFVLPSLQAFVNPRTAV